MRDPLRVLSRKRLDFFRIFEEDFRNGDLVQLPIIGPFDEFVVGEDRLVEPPIPVVRDVSVLEACLLRAAPFDVLPESDLCDFLSSSS